MEIANLSSGYVHKELGGPTKALLQLIQFTCHTPPKWMPHI